MHFIQPFNFGRELHFVTRNKNWNMFLEDGVDDVNDTCIYNKFISTTSFEDYITVDLYPGHSTDPKWKVKAVGREIYQLVDTTKPAMLIGNAVLL
jgi:hypothetical protein